MIRDEIISALKKIAGKAQIDLETPENAEFGDYSSNIAMEMFARTKAKDSIFNIQNSKSPRELAQNIVSKLKLDKQLKNLVEKIEVAGPGFVNFWLKDDALVDNLIQINIEKEKFGSSNIGKNKTMVIDYSSPNIAKPFGIGHLRSTIIGQALYNLYKFSGYECVGDNHLGDWGTQFGTLLAEIYDTKFKIQNLTIENLEKMYVDFHKKAESNPKLKEEARNWFKKLEDGDLEAKKIWQACVDISLKEFDRVYKMLGVKIDFAFGESYYESEMKQLMGDPNVKKYLQDGEDGAKIIDLTKEGIKTPLMFLKSDEATTYATRDLATIKFRARKWDPALIIYEVGAEQTLHFQQVFAAARILGLVKPDVALIHTAHGLYLAPDGKKFSTRKGKTIKLEEVLDEAIKRAKKLGNSDESTANMVGIGAIKYFDLMHGVKSDVVFDWDKIMNLEGNSGPYLQYTVARAQSVLNKSNKRISEYVNKNKLENEELSVLRSLVHFPEIIENAVKLFSPNLLCNYLFDLAQKFNHFYNIDPILTNSDQQVTDFRLALTSGVAQVLKTGLKILGIQTPERM